MKKEDLGIEWNQNNTAVVDCYSWILGSLGQRAEVDCSMTMI